MSTMQYFELLAVLKRLKSEAEFIDHVDINILSNITVHQVREAMEYELLLEGLRANISLGNYDNIIQDAREIDKDHIVIIFWETCNIIDGLQYKYESMLGREQEDIKTKVKEELGHVFSSLKQHRIVFFNKFHSYPFSSSLVSVSPLDQLIEELNTWLEENCPDNFKLIDTRPIYEKLGVEKSINMRNFYSSKALYQPVFFMNYAQQISSFILSLSGKIRKAIILDCDNTLWKGILGEDGPDGIKMSSRSKEGVPFEAVQYSLKLLVKKGVILGLCSKNNAEEVEQVLMHHKDMVLRDEHIVIKKVNWNDKVSSLKEIAAELNIGLDSLIFIDDSDFEVNYVRENLPEIKVFQVPGKLYDYPKMIDEIASGYFDFGYGSQEDGQKVAQYKSQQARKIERDESDSIEDYLKSLEIKISIFRNREDLVPRMAQMTQKTNQFNLTTRRYSEQDMRNMLDDPGVDLYALAVEDKYGDSGVTGLMIIKRNNESSFIDTFLMSCRIIGRNIEYKFASEVMKHLKSRYIQSEYIRTLKNDQVSELYERLGFNVLRSYNGRKEYLMSLDQVKHSDKYNYIKVNNG